MLTRRTLLLALAALPAACAATGPTNTTRLIVLRHADRHAGNPELNATGVARAAALPGAVADLAIDAILIPDIDRNRVSAAPLAAARGLPVQVVAPVTIDTGGLARALLDARPGGTVVWIGNTTNLITLWEELDAPGDPPLGYGDIVLLDIRRGAVLRTGRRRVEA